MISHILDLTTLEQVVTSYQESKLFIPDFELQEWKRDPGKIIWTFSKLYQVESVFDSMKLWFPTYFKPDGIPVCELVEESRSIRFEVGDRLTITYSLEWWYYGDDDEPVTLRPTPGRSLIIECAIAVQETTNEALPRTYQ